MTTPTLVINARCRRNYPSQGIRATHWWTLRVWRAWPTYLASRGTVGQPLRSSRHRVQEFESPPSDDILWTFSEFLLARPEQHGKTSVSLLQQLSQSCGKQKVGAAEDKIEDQCAWLQQYTKALFISKCLVVFNPSVPRLRSRSADFHSTCAFIFSIAHQTAARLIFVHLQYFSVFTLQQWFQISHLSDIFCFVMALHFFRSRFGLNEL